MHFFSFEHRFPYTFTWKFERWHLPEQFCVARGVTRADAYVRTQNNKETRASFLSVYTKSVTRYLTKQNLCPRFSRARVSLPQIARVRFARVRFARVRFARVRFARVNFSRHRFAVTINEHARTPGMHIVY